MQYIKLRSTFHTEHRVKSLDHLEHSWRDMCPPSFAHWDHPGPPPWFPEDELQPSWLRSLMAAGKRLSTVPASLCLSSVLPQLRRLLLTFPQEGGGGRDHSQHFSEGETMERSLEGKSPMMRLGLLWECHRSVSFHHQFS